MFVLAETTLINIDRCDAIRPLQSIIYFFYGEGVTRVVFSTEEDTMNEYMKIIRGIQEKETIVELESVVCVDPEEAE